MTRRIFSLASAVVFAFVLTVAATPAEACPYDSIQVRVQRTTAYPWATSVTVPTGTSIHIGVFKNGWGVPVDPGAVTLYAVQGSYWTPLSLTNGWETWHTSNYASTWSYIAYCDFKQGSASATYTSSLDGEPDDVLSYGPQGDDLTSSEPNPFSSVGGSK